jgi:hypothetical protein
MSIGCLTITFVACVVAAFFTATIMAAFQLNRKELKP